MQDQTGILDSPPQHLGGLSPMNHNFFLRQFFSAMRERDGAASTVGEFQLVVLGVVNELGDDAYGMKIRDRAQDILNRSIHMPQVYSALARLEELGLVESEASTAKSVGLRGRTRRYYKVGAKGSQMLEDAFRHTFRNGPKDPATYAATSTASTTEKVDDDGHWGMQVPAQ